MIEINGLPTHSVSEKRYRTAGLALCVENERQTRASRGEGMRMFTFRELECASDAIESAGAGN